MIDTQWLAEQVAKGLTDAAISAECGVPVPMVAYYRRTQLNIVRVQGNRRKWDIDREWLVAQVVAGKSDTEIAAEKGMTVSAVGQYRRRMKIPPRRPAVVPPLADVRQPVEVYYGHNEKERMVLMAFTSPITQLFFTPEQAEDVAKQLQYRAAAARGKKPA